MSKPRPGAAGARRGAPGLSAGGRPGRPQRGGGGGLAGDGLDRGPVSMCSWVAPIGLSGDSEAMPMRTLATFGWSRRMAWARRRGRAEVLAVR